MATSNWYFIGPPPSVDDKLQKDCKGVAGDNAWKRFHFSLSPDGTQCLANGLFDDSVKVTPPPGFTWLSYAAALAQRQAWDAPK